MNNLFIPYEQALHLKELGFQEECLAYYHQDQMLEKDSLGIKRDHYRGKFGVLAPTFSQAFRWFREKYDIYPIIEAKNYFKSPIKWIYSTCNVNGSFEVGFTNHSTYEEAELACLKKLIEIVKNERK